MAKRTHELEDEIKERDRRIAELKAELDAASDLTYRLSEHVHEANEQTDEWIQAFDMVPDDEGRWIWKVSVIEGDEWLDKYRDLVREWNKWIPHYNAMVRPRNIGRPLAASETQCAEVLKLRKAHMSLRGIAEETGLTLQTVRTIISQRKRTDRTSIKHLSRIDPDRAGMKLWLAKKRMRDGLPKKIHELRATGDELLKEAKGLLRKS